MTESSLTPRFEIADNAPSPWTWDQYESWLKSDWARFLSDTDPTRERPFHDYLEKHPCLLPGGEGSGESFGGHHGGWRFTVISEPTIPGIKRRRPDFMWLTKTSDQIIPVLIELEAPAKPWFNKDGTRSKKLIQAQDQIANWQTAIDNPTNRLQLAELYDFPSRWATRHELEPRYLLIYGRRSQLDDRPEVNQTRRRLRGPVTDAMTYDRLAPIAGLRNAVCIRLIEGTRKVVSIPPTFRLGPRNAGIIAFYTGWEDAVAANECLGNERKDFLISRLPYWRGKGQLERSGQSLGIIGPEDWE